MSFDAVGWLRRRAFPTRGSGAAARIGAEVELLSFDARTHRSVSVERLLSFLLPWAAARGGTRTRSAKAGERIVMPDGGAFAIEPGAQLEYASPPFGSPSALLRRLDEVLESLTAAATATGVELLGAGVDPFNRRDEAPLRVPAERYRRMDAYFETVGPAGRRMMRQTAAVQINVDPAGDPAVAWHALNAASPCMTALLANSAVYAGAPTGFVSYRAETWRRADPARTGLFTVDGDMAEKYARFALGAPVMRRFAPAVDSDASAYRPFADWLDVLADPAEAWADHLTTLFPEVRPKGYYEIRCMDAQPLNGMRLPVLLAAIALDPAATAEAAEVLGDPDPVLLQIAGRDGVAFPRLNALARELVAITVRACERLGSDRVDPVDIARAAEQAEGILGGVAV